MKHLQSFILFSLLLWAVSCNKSSIDTTFNSDPHLFHEYIQNYTTGLVSSHSDFKIVLAFHKNEWQKNQELDNDLFEINPKVKGKTIALSSNTIAFVPENKLEQNTAYQITLNLDKLIKTPKELSKFKFTVKTIAQDFMINTNDLQSYDKNWQYLNAKLTSSDDMTWEEVEKIVKVTQNNKSLKIKKDPLSTSKTEFHFKIDSIQRFEENSAIQISWDGTPLNINQKGSSIFEITGKNNFKIIGVETNPLDSQSLLINFSDPIKKGQNLNGLVALESANQLRFSIVGNILKVYFDEILKGEVLLEVFQGILSEDGYRMKNTFAEKVSFEQIKPEIRILKTGTILPSSNHLKINLEVANLKAMDVKVYKIFQNNILQFLQDNELYGKNNMNKVALPIATETVYFNSSHIKNSGKWNTYALDVSKIISPEPGAIYRVEISFKRAYSLYKCDTPYDPETPEAEISYYDEYDDMYYYDDYVWRDRDNPCTNSFYYNKTIGTNLLASDLGIIAKKGTDKSYYFAVSHLVSTKPIQGAKIALYNYQQQKIAETTTNNQGEAWVETDKPAFFAVGTHENQTTYLKLGDGNSLSVSNFDVSGQKLQKGWKGYIYGERGVWRPGDTLFLGFILNDAQSKLEKSHPIQLKIKNPQGKLMYQSTQKSNDTHHYLFTIPTQSEDPTGNWEATVSVGGAKFYKSIKIETIKPNRLKIKYDFESEILKTKQKNKAEIKVTWLHGAVAKNLKLEVLGKMFKQKTTFKGFQSYVFDDPTRSFESEERLIFSGKTDDLGLTTFQYQPEIEEAPGMLKATFLTKVYENGGDFSTDVLTAIISPYEHYVGIKTPQANKYGMLETRKNNKFDIVSLNQNGQPKPNADLEVKVYKMQWRWWWDASENEIANFNANQIKTVFKTFQVKTDAQGKAHVQFTVNDDDWGRYLIRVEDKKGGHAAATTAVIDWPYWSGKTKNNDASHAAMLVFSTDKKTYQTKENAQISFPSSEGGRALISIENGTKIIQTLWVQTTQGETKVELPIKDEMAPNVYVHITLIQPHASTQNDSPIRMYGIVPIEVVDKNTMLEPQISMPDVLKPEQKTNIKISEKSGKSMTYTLAIVDEGLLDLTRFKTPNAWHSFYSKEALGVKTWDMYDDVIGAYGGKVNQVLSIGGDEDLGGAGAKKANRFKPVVLQLGPFKLEKGKINNHQIQLPKYIGAVRTMVIASHVESEAYGNAEKSTPVRSPLMVLASFPRKVSPGEQVKLPITLFAMENQVKKVSLQLKVKKGLTLKSQAVQTIEFNQPDEKMAYFDVEVDSFEGNSSFEVVATSGNEKASYHVDFEIINPNPITHDYVDLLLEPNAKKTLDFSTFGVSGSNHAQLEIASFPTIDFNRRLQYLIQYPHGCLEQTTSSVFPQLFMDDVVTLSNHQKREVQKNVKSGIQKISGFQLPNGGFSYWPGGNSVDDWSTSYVGHFLLEAEKKGYVLPLQFKQKWIQYQQQASKQWRFNKTYVNDQAQAYRLFTLALSGQPDMASMNRLRETIGLGNEAKIRLASAYALAGQKNIGLSLLNQSVIESNDKNNQYYGSIDRNRAMTLETLVLLNNKAKAFEMAQKIAKSMSSDAWMSTQTTAYCLLSMSKFAMTNSSKETQISLTSRGKTQKHQNTKIIQIPLEIQQGNNQVTLQNHNENNVYVRLLTSGILPLGQEKVNQSKLSTQVVFKSRNGTPLDVSKITQGTTFFAEITIKNTTSESIQNVALSQILPSGFEIINARYTDFGGESSNKADYIDIRDDRSNFYFPLKAQETLTFKVVINASYLGRYYLPGLQAEAMYDNTYFARTHGKWIEILKE